MRRPDLLRTRVLTAAIFAPAALAAVILLPPPAFRIAVAALLMVGCWEFTRLAALSRATGLLLLALQLVVFLLLVRYWDRANNHALAFLTAACLSWCVMFLRLLTFRPAQAPGLNYRFVSAFSALASLAFGAIALYWLHGRARGEFLVLLLLIIIWAADVGAYFAGRRFGRHRLAPSISPGKTREGMLGGLFLAVAAGIVFVHASDAVHASAPVTALLAGMTVLASVGGDLFISIHKRTVGLKDTGTLFPGHGGVLDRFDSLLAGAPFFALGVLLVERTAR